MASLLGLVMGASCQLGENVKPTDGGQVVVENILSRKSVRRYVEGKPVEKEKVEQLLRAGMAAPSGMDCRPWEFAVIDEREKLDKMADELPYAKMLKGVPMAIVVCADERKSSYLVFGLLCRCSKYIAGSRGFGIRSRMDCNLSV